MSYIGLKLRIYPDEDTKKIIEQNIHHNRFVWNKVLEYYKKAYELFKFHGCPLYPNINTLNAILMLLKDMYPFLRDGESTSQQQTIRDLNKAFNRFFKCKSNYPNFKKEAKTTPSFRIQHNRGNIRASNRRIRLPKIGQVHFRTSKKYRKLLKSSKINNVTVKRSNGKYYAIVNITTEVEPLSCTGENIGIDLGIKNLATLSDGTEITNLDLSREDKMIRKYQKQKSRQQKGSNNYKKTLKKYHKWQDRKNNKISNDYHHFSKYLVKNFDVIAMENLNIRGMFKNRKWAPKLQKIGLYKLLRMIKYKSELYGKKFIQIDRFFPSSKICSVCGYIKQDLTLDIREWTCPNCETHHNRDVNAAKNILNEALKQM